MQTLVARSALRRVAHGVDRPEGICLAPDGALYVSGGAGQLYRITPDDSAIEVARTGGRVLGLAADAASNIYACDIDSHCVWRFNPADWSRSVFTRGPDDEPLVVPNWGAFGPDGTYFLSDSGEITEVDGRRVGSQGRIIAVRGSHASVWSRFPTHFPNGLAVEPDGSALYIIESYPGRLLRIPILPDGAAGTPEVLATWPDLVPDGIAFATDGSLAITCYRPDLLLLRSPDGTERVIAADPDHTDLVSPTNCAFHGPDLASVSIPNIGADFVTRLVVPGVRGEPLFYPTPGQIDSGWTLQATD